MVEPCRFRAKQLIAFFPAMLWARQHSTFLVQTIFFEGFNLSLPAIEVIGDGLFFLVLTVTPTVSLHSIFPLSPEFRFN